MAKYIFRLDDISQNMNWDNFLRLYSIFRKFGVKPIIGVIPNNQDPQLLSYPLGDENFWDLVRKLQCKEGWSVALHGYNHLFETKDSGILGINNYSEFAGIPLKEQCKKIKKGKKIFDSNEIKINAFMAPAHSFDEHTLYCLKKHAIFNVTDGFSLFPYRYNDILFVPQLFATPRKMLLGVHTWCIHPNTLSEEEIKNIEQFIKNNQKNIISFEDAQKYQINAKLGIIHGVILKHVITMMRKLKKYFEK